MSDMVAVLEERESEKAKLSSVSRGEDETSPSRFESIAAIHNGRLATRGTDLRIVGRGLPGFSRDIQRRIGEQVPRRARSTTRRRGRYGASKCATADSHGDIQAGCRHYRRLRR